MAITTANKVADYILCETRKAGDLVTNLWLQKIVYYAQAWYLALYDEPLFGEQIEAWVHGPAQPALYRRFKQYEWHPITEEVGCPTFSTSRVKAHLKEILQVYGDKTALQLEVLTHTEEPWRAARGGLPDHEQSTAVISRKSMKEYYRGKLQNG